MTALAQLDVEIGDIEQRLERMRAARSLLAGDAPAAEVAGNPRRARAPRSEGHACKVCGTTDVSAFGAEPRNKNGLQSRCRTCTSAAARERYAAKKAQVDPPSTTLPPARPDPFDRLALIRKRASGEE